VIDDAELAAATAARPHWQLDEQGAVYVPSGAAAHMRIRPVRTPARAWECYLASVIEGQAAVHSTPLPTAAAAVQWSEIRNLSCPAAPVPEVASKLEQRSTSGAAVRTQQRARARLRT
jgi:hypothetical protein